MVVPCVYLSSAVEWSPAERDLYTGLREYKDVLVATRTVENASGLRDLTVLHALNHALVYVRSLCLALLLCVGLFPVRRLFCLLYLRVSVMFISQTPCRHQGEQRSAQGERCETRRRVYRVRVSLCA
jgi:hypothetical protein